MAEKEKQSFVIYRNWMEMVMGLPDDEALDLTRTIFAYCLNRDYEPGTVAAAIFDTIEPMIESDIEKWHRTCEIRAAVGSKGGKQKVANAKQTVAIGKQLVAIGKQKQADNDTDNDTDTVNDNDTVSVNESVPKKEDAIASKKEIVAALVAKWNSYTERGKIPLVRFVSVDSKTGKSVLQRYEERGQEEVLQVIDAVFRSDYLKGYINGWCAKFDWVFLKTNYEKVLNGNFENDSRSGKQNVVDQQNDLIDKWVSDIRWEGEANGA